LKGNWSCGAAVTTGRQEEEIYRVIHGLTQAWNAGDSLDFAGHFAEDGDLVNIHGMRLHGRAAIAGLYDMLFRSVFRGSRLETELSGSRRLADDAVLLHVRVRIEIPAGAMPGVHSAVASGVLKREDARWCVASLHITLVTEGMDWRQPLSAGLPSGSSYAAGC